MFKFLVKSIMILLTTMGAIAASIAIFQFVSDYNLTSNLLTFIKDPVKHKEEVADAKNDALVNVVVDSVLKKLDKEEIVPEKKGDSSAPFVVMLFMILGFTALISYLIKTARKPPPIDLTDDSFEDEYRKKYDDKD